MTETIARLRNRGIEVEVLAPSYRGMDQRDYEGIPVHRFRYAPAALETLTHDQTAPDRIRERPLYSALLPGYMIGGSLAAARLARSGRFDCIHAFWPIPHGLIGLAARAAGGTPLVSTFFGVELTWVRSQLPFLAPFVRGIIRRSDVTTVISNHTAAEVRRFVPGASVRIIPFGAAIGASPPRQVRDLGQRGELDDSEGRSGRDSRGHRDDRDDGGHRETLRAPRDRLDRGGAGGAFPAAGQRPVRLLFVGRLVERKGVAVLLKAVSDLRGRRDVRLKVVGDGPLRPHLESRAAELGISESVEFTGYVDEAEVDRAFTECDIFVLPAIRDSKGDVEGLGVVLLEAMQYDRPVVASASGGIPDIVIDGETGLLTRPGDASSIVAAIERMLDSPGLRDRLVDSARAHLASSFSWDRIIDDLVSVYEEVSANRRRGGRADRTDGPDAVTGRGSG